MNLDSHPAAQLFPLMGESELAELAEDIKQNGQLEPITLFQGLILDGRNRAAACKILGIAPVTVQVDTDAPTQFVIAKNLHRRHLDTSQRATIAAEMVALLREEAHQRQIAGLKQFEAKNEQNPNKSPLWPNGRNGESREIAAEALNVSARTVQRAMMVKRHDPALFEKVKKGEIPVNTAAREVDRQKQNLTGRESIRANVHKRRMEQGLSTMRITCTCLNESLDVSRALSACDQSEVDHWLKVIEEVVKGLGLFSKTLTF